MFKQIRRFICARLYDKVRPAFLNMIREVIKFGKKAPEVLELRNEAKFHGGALHVESS